MYLCDGNGRKVIRGETVRYLLFMAACHTAQNMVLATNDGQPLVRCIVDGTMPQCLQKVLRGETPWQSEN